LEQQVTLNEILKIDEDLQPKTSLCQ